MRLSVGLEDWHDIIEDLSAGQWRRRAFASEAEWPAVATQFERLKILCAGRDGARLVPPEQPAATPLRPRQGSRREFKP